MANIKKELQAFLKARFGEEIRQSLHDSVYAINEQVEHSETSAGASASVAMTNATQAKQSAEAAKTSETNAKQYAQQAFSTTPDGYQSLVEEVGRMDIQTSTEKTLNGSKAGGLKVNGIWGKSEQEQYIGKNTLDCSGLAESTINGITFTPIYDKNGSLLYVKVNCLRRILIK